MLAVVTKVFLMMSPYVLSHKMPNFHKTCHHLIMILREHHYPVQRVPQRHHLSAMLAGRADFVQWAHIKPTYGLKKLAACVHFQSNKLLQWHQSFSHRVVDLQFFLSTSPGVGGS